MSLYESSHQVSMIDRACWPAEERIREAWMAAGEKTGSLVVAANAEIVADQPEATEVA